MRLNLIIVILYNLAYTMPLYEMMIIAKCSTPENLASTATYIAKSIWKHGGVVRDVKILTDR